MNVKYLGPEKKTESGGEAALKFIANYATKQKTLL